MLRFMASFSVEAEPSGPRHRACFDGAWGDPPLDNRAQSPAQASSEVEILGADTREPGVYPGRLLQAGPGPRARAQSHPIILAQLGPLDQACPHVTSGAPERHQGRSASRGAHEGQ